MIDSNCLRVSLPGDISFSFIFFLGRKTCQ
nr:MAG TPA: hypothetical protein [Caudoviricetes sp.]